MTHIYDSYFSDSLTETPNYYGDTAITIINGDCAEFNIEQNIWEGVPSELPIGNRTATHDVILDWDSFEQDDSSAMLRLGFKWGRLGQV